MNEFSWTPIHNIKQWFKLSISNRKENDFTIGEVKKIDVPISKRRLGNNSDHNNPFHRIDRRFKDNDSDDDENAELKQLESKLLK